MKKKLFLGLAALAAVALTSCQKDQVINQVPQEQPIGFGTYVGRDAQTKASVTDKDAMENDDYSGFGVFAYYTGAFVWNATDLDGTTAGNQAPTPNFMYNQQVDYNGSKWYYSPVKYWPNSTDKISFFAYAPYTKTDVTPAPTENVTGFSATNDTGYPTVSFKVARTVAEQVDLLYASAIDQYQTSTEVTGTSDNGVKFTFNHALSRVGFKVKTAREDYRVQVTSITLTGDFNTSGTCTLENGSFTSVSQTDDKTYTFNTFNNANSNKINSTEGVIITPDGQYLMTIPQNFTTDGITVSVTYKYEYKYGSGANDYAQETENTQDGTVKLNLEKGNAYTLVMELDPLNPIVFSVDSSVEGWSTPSETTAIPTQGV